MVKPILTVLYLQFQFGDVVVRTSLKSFILLLTSAIRQTSSALPSGSSRRTTWNDITVEDARCVGTKA